jgi:hypothetical protein
LTSNTKSRAAQEKFTDAPWREKWNKRSRRQSAAIRERGQPRSASEGWAQDNYHLCEEEDRFTRPSGRPSGWRSLREQTVCPAAFGK